MSYICLWRGSGAGLPFPVERQLRSDSIKSRQDDCVAAFYTLYEVGREDTPGRLSLGGNQWPSGRDLLCPAGGFPSPLQGSLPAPQLCSHGICAWRSRLTECYLLFIVFSKHHKDRGWSVLGVLVSAFKPPLPASEAVSPSCAVSVFPI